MKVSRIRIKNFRALEDVEIELHAQTAILGGNGCGKSSILRAIDRFFGQQTAMEADDFFGRDITRTIEIELTFDSLGPAETSLFGSRVHNGVMTVTRVFDSAAGKSNGRYFGSTMKHSRFDEIRAADGARDRTAAYNRLRSSDDKYASLPPVQRADQIPALLAQWEQDAPTDCELGRDDGQFFGFSNVAKGSLQRAVHFVFIPAVRDAAADTLDSRNSVVARLMELVVRNAIQRRADIQDFQARITTEFKALTDPGKLPELDGLARALSGTLRTFYADSAVALNWLPSEDLRLPLPAAEVLLDDDGFLGPVDRKGHGLQRALVVTLLQHLAAAASEAGANQADDSNLQAEPDSAPPLPQIAPTLILAIEEPELYQHPTKQRHFARVLTELSEGRIPGVAGITQVLFASHSPLFVSVDRFDQVRIAQRTPSESGPLRACSITSTSLERVIDRLESAYGSIGMPLSVSAFRSRLHILGPELAEGFFATVAVLVEGASDRAALVATAAAAGLDLQGLGVAVLPVGGKSNLDRPAAIFAEFSIPTYLVIDCDSASTGQDRVAAAAMNKMLQRLSGVSEEHLTDFSTIVSDRFACFDDTLEAALKNEIGAVAFQNNLEAVKASYGISRNKDALKVPAVVSDVLNRARSNGLKSESLLAVVDAIRRLREATLMDANR